MLIYFPLIVTGLFVLGLIWHSRKSLVAIIVAISGGERPAIWISRGAKVKCPTCGELMALSSGPRRKGDDACHCPTCGVKVTWG